MQSNTHTLTATHKEHMCTYIHTHTKNTCAHTCKATHTRTHGSFLCATKVKPTCIGTKQVSIRNTHREVEKTRKRDSERRK